MKWIATVLVCLVLGAGVVHARQTDPRLDALFGSLQVAENPFEISFLQQTIWEVWTESGSDTIDLLMKRSRVAMNDGELEKALEILERITKLDPDFAEGWNRKATVQFLMGRYEESVADIERTLDLEPRHFGALTGLAQIRERQGKKQRALEAWRRALQINPHLDQARQRIKALEPEVEGRGI